MKKLLAIIISIYCANAYAQNTLIEAIQANYEIISKEMKACANANEENPCALYKNVLTINSQKKPWPSLGVFNKTEEFWFLDNPKNCVECADKGVSALKTVTINEHYEDIDIRKEFVFNDGRLEFIFIQTKTIKHTRYERLYFSAENALIRYADDAKVFDGQLAYTAQLAELLAEAQRVQLAFLNSF